MESGANPSNEGFAHGADFIKIQRQHSGKSRLAFLAPACLASREGWHAESWTEIKVFGGIRNFLRAKSTIVNQVEAKSAYLLLRAALSYEQVFSAALETLGSVDHTAEVVAVTLTYHVAIAGMHILVPTPRSDNELFES